jgi:hypothetical protein
MMRVTDKILESFMIFRVTSRYYRLIMRIRPHWRNYWLFIDDSVIRQRATISKISKENKKGS